MATKSHRVGERLKALRSETSMTLSAVAQQTGVSVSNLSKIERGEVSPSFDVIIRICEGLGIAIEQFIKPGPKTAVSGRKTVTLRGQASHFACSGYEYFAHATELSRNNMVPLDMWVRARRPEDFVYWSEHSGEEFVYVISGSIEVHTEHYAPFPLQPGESAYFDSGMKHVYVSTSEQDAHVHSVSYSAEAARPGAELDVMNPSTRQADKEETQQWEASPDRQNKRRS